jgi:hypothetical protein
MSRPAVYTVKAAVAGFKTFERKDARIGTQQFFTMDIVLEVGAIEERITVTAESPLIETSNASTGDVLDKTTLETLPSHQPHGVPGQQHRPDGDLHRQSAHEPHAGSNRSITAGAGRWHSVGNNYLLDGFPITDVQNRASASPSIEALEDVKVQVHTYDAEMGRTGGGMFNATAKSGTNRMSGAAFLLVRPGSLIEQNFFLKLQNVPNAKQFWRNAGGGVGGPVIRTRRSSGSRLKATGTACRRTATCTCPPRPSAAAIFRRSPTRAVGRSSFTIRSRPMP